MCFPHLKLEKGLNYKSQDQKNPPNFEEFRSKSEINVEHYTSHHLKGEKQHVTALEMPAAFPQCSKPPLNYKTLASPSLWDTLTRDDNALMDPNAFPAKLKAPKS